MSLIYCVEKQGRTGSAEALVGADFQRTWEIKLSLKNENVYPYITDLQNAGTLPFFLQPHPYNMFASCRRMHVKDDNSGFLYTVTADYSTKPLSQEQKERSQQQNPLDRRPRRWMEFLEYERATDKDRDNKGICTSAGTKFPEPAYIPASDCIIHVRQNIVSWVNWPELYNNKLNANPVTVRPLAIAIPRTYAEETVLFKFAGYGEPQEENGIVYCEMSYRLHIREDGWKDSRLDEDLYYKDDGELKRIQVDGQDAVSPVPLNGAGGILANPTSDNVVFRDFDTIPVVDMTELSILDT